MFKFKKKEAQDADVSILDELIGKCEDSMVSPFKKAKAVAVEVKPEEGSDKEEATETPAEEKAEGADDDESKEKPDLSDMDLQDLLKLYEEIKAKKGE